MKPFISALLLSYYICFAISFSSTSTTDTAPPWSIRSISAYQSQRACAQGCFYNIDIWTTNLIASVLSCTQPCLESCCCRSDLQVIAEAYLSSCVSGACSANTIDVQGAVDVYEGYCTPIYPPPQSDKTTITTMSNLPPTTAPPWSIRSLDIYQSQRACAQGCFYNIDVWTTNLIASELSCTQPCLESCCCRPDLQAVAEAYLSSCVESACSSDTVDIQSAISIYAGYCTPIYPPAVSSSSPTTTKNPESYLPSVAATSTIPVVTHTSSPYSAQPNSISGSGAAQGLTESDKISLGVGISIPIFAIIVSVVIFMLQRKYQRNLFSISRGRTIH